MHCRPLHWMRPREHGRRGVTLVEVVIAIFVLTVGVLSIISLFPSGYALSQASVDRSIAALAARDALARVLAVVKHGDLTLPETSAYPGASATSWYYTLDTATLGRSWDHLYMWRYYSTGRVYGVSEAIRVAIVSDVSDHSLTCKILGDVVPDPLNATPAAAAIYWPDLAGYYLVVTSGSAAGHVFAIASSTQGTVNFASTGSHAVTFRAGTSTGGLPVRAGDHVAIIGNLTGSLCYPLGFVGGSADRTVKIATQGDPTRPWQYSYGCIITAGSLGSRRMFRLDIFVYRNFQDAGSLEEQDRPVGHFVSHIPTLGEYGNF